MTCTDIYNTALALIGEPRHTASTADYSERAPFLISLVFRRLGTLSDRFTGNNTDVEGLSVTSLNEPYPLAPELFEAVCLNLASLLILDELPDVSEVLSKRAAASENAASMALNSVSHISGGKVL